MYSLLQWSRSAGCRTWVEFSFKLQKLSHFFVPPYWYFSTPSPTQVTETLKVYSSAFAGSVLFSANKHNAETNDSFPPLWNTALPRLTWTDSRQQNDKGNCRHTWSCEIKKMFLFSFTLTVKYCPVVKLQIKSSSINSDYTFWGT